MSYTYRIETGPEGSPEVWIDNEEGYAMIHQPHHPNAVNFAPWGTREEAEIWATGYVNGLNNPPAPVEKEEL